MTTRTAAATDAMRRRRQTAAATRAVIRKGQETKADELRAAGWLVVAPDDPREVLLTDDGRVFCPDDRCLATAPPLGPVRVARLVESLGSGLRHLDRHRDEAAQPCTGWCVTHARPCLLKEHPFKPHECELCHA